MDAVTTFLAEFTLTPLWDFLLTTVLGKMILGLITSFIFIFMLLKIFSPKIKISPNICYSKISGQYYYVFKIVNMSRFDAYDIRFHLAKKEPYVVNSGTKINNTIRPVTTNTNNRNNFAKYKRKDGYGDHAYLIRSDEDLNEIISNNEITVTLTVSARHGLTNLTRIVSQDYLSVDCIHKDKEFKFGKSLAVM